MNSEEFEAAGQQMIKYVIDYHKTIRERRVLPDVKPGFMRKLLPDHAPQTPEKWDQVYKDIERVIMPGVTHWHHPHFYAYFPTANSYPAILADILSDTIACIGFTWASCPSCTELEVIVMDWLVKVMDLPESFLSTSPGHGGGVIQGTASEATLVAVLSARTKFLNRIKEKNPGMEDGVALTKLVAYTSRQSHSSVERAYMIALVKYRILDTDEKQSLRGDTLKKAIDEDKAKGLTPFFTGEFSFKGDNLQRGRQFMTLLHNSDSIDEDRAKGLTPFFTGEFSFKGDNLQRGRQFMTLLHSSDSIDEDRAKGLTPFFTGEFSFKGDNLQRGRQFMTLLHSSDSIDEDRAKGLTPFFTGEFSFKGDNLQRGRQFMTLLHSSDSIDEDRAKGLTPFFTGEFSFKGDNLQRGRQFMTLLHSSDSIDEDRAKGLTPFFTGEFSFKGDNLQRGRQFMTLLHSSDSIDEDRAKGLTPFFICATLGTTSSCAFDNCKEVGLVAEQEDIWMHIDAAYAGSSFICPEYRPILDGVEHADSFNFNPHKWMQVTFDCSTMWVKNSKEISQSFSVEPVYLKHENEGLMPDYRHWHVPLGRRFRSLKLWFVLRLFGVKGLQDIIREDIKLAHKFENYIRKDPRFEIFGEVIMALVCFRLKGSNEINEKLIKRINDDGRIHMVPSEVDGTFFLRLSICTTRTQNHDIDLAWKVVSELANNLAKTDK